MNATLHTLLQTARFDALFAPGLHEQRAAMSVAWYADALDNAIAEQTRARLRDQAEAAAAAERDAALHQATVQVAADRLAAVAP